MKPLQEDVFTVNKDGIQIKVSALSDHWVQPRCYTNYKKIPIRDGKLVINGAVLYEWLNEAQWFNKDLEFLLKLEHHSFWSHMVYEKRCIEVIVCFLQEAVPYYISFKSSTINLNVINAYSEILQNVLRIICRLITNKETDNAWITKLHLKELLYSKFLISIPMIFDIIIAYGRTNSNILTKIVRTVFQIQPRYNDDLKIALCFLQNTFVLIRRKAEGSDNDEDNKVICSFDDLALHSLDCASILSILLEIYPDVREFCAEIKLEQSISNFYDNTISLLYRNIYTINNCSESLTYLNKTRIELIKAFRSIVYLHIENILKKPEKSLVPAEKFVGILTICLEDRTFVVDYQKYYPVQNDIDIVKQACKEMDDFDLNFILKGYANENESESGDMLKKNGVQEYESCGKNEFEPETEMKAARNSDWNSQNTLTRDVDSEVLSVLDVLPHLGDGFIRKLLPRYENAAQAVQAILENNLPPDLVEADQNEIYIPPDSKDVFLTETGIERYNIFDGDEYDVLSRDNPNCIIKTKKGFPGQPKNVKQLLDDKSYVKKFKERYRQYDMVEDDHEYEDEYDDSYDALADSESKITKSKIIRDVILDEVEDEIEEGNEEDVRIDSRDKSKDFCENPEDIRARYEANRNVKLASRSGRKNQQGSTDVIEKVKGQSRSKETIDNRRKKEVHKSSRANHNRKSGASWKRSRGMIPS